MRRKASTLEIVNDIEKRLSKKRLKHVLGVRDMAVEYARAHGVNAEQAELAALLHDVAKSMSVEDQLAACERYGVPLSEDDRAQPSVLHAFVAAEIAAEQFGMDPAVCQAIRAHTTGWVPMSPLDMALYVADFSEPSRTYPEAAEVRILALEDLTGATLKTMTFKLGSLLRRGLPIHPRTVLARNALLQAERSIPEPTARGDSESQRGTP